MSKAKLLIDRISLLKNLKQIREVDHGNFFCAVVKSNAYGQGDWIISQILECATVDMLGVGRLEEAIHLRRNGIKKPILLLGVFEPEECESFIPFQVTPIIYSRESWAVLKSYDFKKKLPVHLKVNTGMNRLGMALDDAFQVLQELKDNSRFQLTGLMTHLSCGFDFDQGEKSYSARQLEDLRIFLERAESFSKVKIHVFNTQGLLSFYSSKKNHCKFLEFSHFGCRIGIGLYGFAPGVKTTVELVPVSRLISKIVYISEVKPGSSVSYGAKWKAKKLTWVGVVPVGYADGLPYSATGKAWVGVMNQKCSVLGSITMDYILIDLSCFQGRGLSRDSLLGKEVVIFGSGGPSAQDWADWSNSHVWEFLSGMSSRIHREAWGEGVFD